MEVFELNTLFPASTEKMSRTAQEMNRSAQQAGKIFSGYVVESQEINTELVRRATETWIEAFRKQTELNQRMIQRLYGEAEGQIGAVEDLARDWMSAYSVPFFDPFGFNPFAFWRGGLQRATRNSEQVTDITRRAATNVARMNGGFPIVGYDDLNIAEISGQLDALTVEELRTVREHERRTKNRETLLEQIDRKIRAANS
jgi:hypothetical protein